MNNSKFSTNSNNNINYISPLRALEYTTTNVATIVAIISTGNLYFVPFYVAYGDLVQLPAHVFLFIATWMIPPQ